MEIDAAQAEVDAARDRLNNSIRAMYVKGRMQTLVQLVSSTDVSEFLAWYDNMITVASSQAASFKAVKDKRKRLRVLEEKLNAFKQEQATLNTSADTKPIEATLEQKKSELAANTLKFHQELADKGDAYGQYLMGLRYMNGDGVEKDWFKASDYLGKAALQGREDASAELRKLLARRASQTN